MRVIYNEKYNQSTDNELITLYKSSNESLFLGILYKRYAHLVLGLCFKYLKNEDESKDAVMQIFEKLLIDLKRFEIQYFKSWLYTYSKNHCLLSLRNKQSKLRKDIDLKNNASLFMETEVMTHLNEANQKESTYILLENAINELNEGQKKCIHLFYFKEKTYQEISDLTGYSLNEVKSFIQNGKRNLKIKLENKGE
ncbi:MAG: sigma-70 family RNA polymerase sigma factor [Bacteroidia bacterium]|nr:sigma-70 family RNA polymerase sigma factor [Bacteroidia bacterium]